MRLILGPAGSGKTASILNEFREALRAHNHAVRLLVPTATLAEHLQNQLAREGLVFRRSLIQTLSRFVHAWAHDLPEVPDAVFYLLVEEAAHRVNRPEFARVAGLSGFYASLARTISELSSAGCDAARLAASLPDAPLAAAFLAVYQEVERQLDRRGLWLRARRLERAAERIRSEGTGGIRTVWLDGFHALPDPELHILAAIGHHADVTLALDPSDLTDAIRAITSSETRTTPARPNPRFALVRASCIEREVEEIAGRILEQAAAGRPFREIGIIVRPAETYVPLLRSALERFGIPAHFYFDSKLEDHAAIRYLTGIVAAMLAGWDHAAILAALRMAPRLADSNTMDRFDFRVRQQIPNRGLDALRRLCGVSERLLQQIDNLAAIDEWRGLSLTPKGWAARLAILRNLFRPATLSIPRHDLALIWRSQATALDLFDQVLEEVSTALDPEAEIRLEHFWRAIKAVLRIQPLRLADNRRNVVHVLSAPEARQWVLPVVFICGTVEKQFPQVHRQDPFLPESARARLNAAGIRVRTTAGFERDERALFDAAITRATMLVTLSYPEFDTRGDRNLPSLFLDSILLAPQEARPVRPARRNVQRPPALCKIQRPELLEYLLQRTARLSPTGLESFLQCPFQYFGGQLLKLQTAPPRPEERLDFRTQGSIVHEVLAAWWSNRSSIEELFQEIFNRHCQKNSIPVSYHTERLRNAMLRDLAAFTFHPKSAPVTGESYMEETFAHALNESVTISGKIDRLDLTVQGARVTDYKYSPNVKARLEDKNLLQAPLYLLAAERKSGLKPAAMDYIGLKRDVTEASWETPFPDGFFEEAIDKTLRAVDQIRRGRIEPQPADPRRCRYCDCRDACRIDTERETLTADAAAEGA